jgi:long-chain acyl-CoA synthetase
MDSIGVLRSDDLEYLWLPLAHSFGKVLISGQIKVGFAAAVDGRVDKIVEHLGEVQPTFIAAVPRIFEKIYGGIQTMQEREGGAKLKIFRWAEGVGAQAGKARREGKNVGCLLGLQYQVADRLVFSKVRARMGGKVRFFVSGSAALSQEVAEWFDNAGLVIYEGYGLTETSAFTFVNRPHNYTFGTVGAPAFGTEVKIADDGEILVKGPGVMQGYHNLPEQTAEVFTDDWFHTGDIGEVSADGLLKITDRKKDLIKTSGGKYVAPQSIEVKFKAACPYASNIVVHGDGRNFVSALVTLDETSIKGWAEENGISGDYAQIVADPKTKEMVQGYIDEVNAQLPRWETVKKFEILPHDLSIESGELTPSLKVKRKVVEQKYTDVLDSFYS